MGNCTASIPTHCPFNHIALTFHLTPNLAPYPPKTRHPFQLEACLQIISPILLYHYELIWKPILEGKRPEVLLTVVIHPNRCLVAI